MLYQRESYPSYQCHGDDIIGHVTMAVKEVLAHWKNRLRSIQKQITCPDGHWSEQFGNCHISLHTATAPAVRAAVKTVVSCRCFAKCTMHWVLVSSYGSECYN